MGVVKKIDPEQGRFQVMSVEKTAAPDGCADGNWYRYVIGEGNSEIVGCRQGTRRQVTRHASEYAEVLNLRTGKKGGSYWAPRKKS